MLLRLDNVAKLYGQKLVFKGLSLELDAGETALVAGPNGAGKSTLLRLAAGLEEPTAGQAHCQAGPGEIGYLGHATFIYPQLSALENLLFWTSYWGRKRDDALLHQALERMGLAYAAHERAGRFSRGMAQRLSLARVFVLGPKLLLLDEPGTGLDVASREILAREIQAAKTRGAGILWVSHHMEQDLPLADKVLAIQDGRQAYSGAAQEYTPEAVA